jgi:hypothetical protein
LQEEMAALVVPRTRALVGLREMVDTRLLRA